MAMERSCSPKRQQEKLPLMFLESILRKPFLIVKERTFRLQDRAFSTLCVPVSGSLIQERFLL